MGYTTDFDGYFKLNKKLDAETLALLQGLGTTRRMARNLKGYGIEGEFYVDSKDDYGQNRTTDIIDYNRPPKTQPGLWCQWVPTANAQGIEHDGGEKFYEYTAWIEYLIKKVLAPRGYTLNGCVQWRGEDFNDIGTIEIIENVVKEHHGEYGGYTLKKSKK